MKLGLLLLEPKLGLLGPVLELLTPLPHLLRLGIAPRAMSPEHVSELLGPLPHRLLGLDMGLEGLDLIHGFVIHRFVRLLIDRFVEISIESLEILFRGESAFLRRQRFRRRLRFGLDLRLFLDRPVPAFGGADLTSRVPVGLLTEDLCIGGNTLLGGRLFRRLLPLGLHLRAFVVLLRLIDRCPCIVFLRAHGPLR